MDVPLFCLWLLGLSPIVTGATFDQARVLINDKLTNYTRMLRPRINQTEQVEVKVAAELVTIQQFDEVEGHLSVMIIFNLRWKDEIMVWNPQDCGGIRRIEINNEFVWTPTIVLVNSVASFEKLGDSSWTTVSYTAEGDAYYSPGDMLSSKCSVDVTFYPWDRHVCKLQFSTWNRNTLNITGDKLRKTYYSPNEIWVVTDSKIVNIPRFWTLNIFITLDRKSNFVILNVILPIVFMAVMSVLVFLVPAESGERISYSITMLLAIAVFLTIVSDNLPKISNPMSYFSYYIVCIIIINILTALANIFSIRIYHNDKHEQIGRFWEGLTRCLMCKNKQGRQNTPQVRKDETPVLVIKNDSRKTMYARSKIDKTEIQYIGNDFIHTVQNVTDEKKITHDKGFNQGQDPNLRKWHSNNRKTIASVSSTNDEIKEDSTNKVNVSWKDVSVMVDRMSFLLSMFCIIVTTTSFFIVVTNRYDITGK